MLPRPTPPTTCMTVCAMASVGLNPGPVRVAVVLSTGTHTCDAAAGEAACSCSTPLPTPCHLKDSGSTLRPHRLTEGLVMVVSTLQKAQHSLVQTRRAQAVHQSTALYKNARPPTSVGVFRCTVPLRVPRRSTAVHAYNTGLAFLVKSRAPVAPWGFSDLGASAGAHQLADRHSLRCS